MTTIVVFCIRMYRWFVSPFLPPRCRFEPSCSRYAIHALEHHGLRRGGWMAVRRLMRCHPMETLGGSWGYDPVPSVQAQTSPSSSSPLSAKHM